MQSTILDSEKYIPQHDTAKHRQENVIHRQGPQRAIPPLAKSTTRYRSGSGVCFAPGLAEAMTANNVHPGTFLMTNVAAVRGSKPACHLHTHLHRTNPPMTRSMVSVAAGTD